ncbi:DNA topoisomerase 2 isoform X2 [Oratosquilla oratoria]|uniref:DNA topoisomerase 2 isoform X2 n=1 Tax=Oratosquilla oratoria TaxID=337810 RepID=UPI003F75C0CD
MPTQNGTQLIDNMQAKVAANGVDGTGPVGVPEAGAPAKGGKKTVEKIYQKKTQLEHILLRPDTYIGSVEPVTEQQWVYDYEDGIVQREITYVPGLYKIFDEILVNAADNKQRDPKMDTIKIELDAENNVITIFNNGQGIPVVMHKDEKMFVPTMIFGHLLTSSNYNDEEQKVTGGRNGFGAKLCNIFSTKFTVETACQDYKKSFKQTWGNSMAKASEAKIKEFNGDDFTRITFSPDLAKFKMTSLDKDIISLMSRRAFDVAASTRGVKVYLNGKKIPIKNFKDYVDLYLKDKTDDGGNQIKSVYESAGGRWEVAVAISDKGFQQMSFVNSIATTKGGRHIDYVSDMIVKNLIESIKKKNKGGIQIRPFQIKNHMWLFVNCLIVNPAFDSQTKENMITQTKNFGSKCTFSDKFVTSVTKCGIVEAVMAWAKFKQQAQLQSKCASKKQNKIKGIPKLEDANNAGTRFSSECTLILTEGDSAKTLAVAGLGVVGRDNYGVFPLRGKLLNVREASHNKILENAEINHIIKILGLQYKKSYETEDDLKTLRYRRLMIMTDQDQDGSHIKGLLINFIHHYWPTLLRTDFLEEFITPIVKASKGNESHSFYSLPEFEEWKREKDNWHTYKIKYYKGLGTSTSNEAKAYFTDMNRHRIFFHHNGTQDDHSIVMAFSKKCVDQRKEWLTTWMQECKRRKELGLPEIYLYEKTTKSINYADFVNKELVLFSNLDNERSIPSLVDGLKPGQRKVLFTCLKRNDKREVKVAQLAGSIAEHSAYHHGETSLMSTIINLAQNFVGSNNINILQPIGQFGTRLQGGKDSASPRYIFTMLSPLARHIFHPHDDPLLKYLYDDNQRIEPEWYIPVIPMILVNGAEGIGTGWSTRIHNYNPREIITNLRRMIRGDEMKPMKPWFKNFRGTIEYIDNQRFVCNGEVSILSSNKVEITELPIRTWTQMYKETVLETMLHGSDKTPPAISDYKEYNTDTTVKFVVSMTEDRLAKAEEEGLHKLLKLQSTIGLTTMVVFDACGVLRRYDTVEQIMQEFFTLRMKFYGLRKNYLVGMLEAEASRLSNQARFILEKCDGRLTVENKKKKDMIAELERKGYDSDPVKAWKTKQDREGALEEDMNEEEEEDEAAEAKLNYDYLLGMPMWNLTKEKKDEILKNRDLKLQELKGLRDKTPEDIWFEDLRVLEEQLDIVEQKEISDAEASVVLKVKGGKGAGGNKRSKKLAEETLPSSTAMRVEPRIDADLKKKAEKAAALKEKIGKKPKKAPETTERDEFDEIVSNNTGKSLTARLGNSPDMIKKKATKPKLNFKPKEKPKLSENEIKLPKMKEKKIHGETLLQVSPKKKKANPWDTDSEENDDLSSDDNKEVIPRERTASSRRAAAANVKFNFDDEDEEHSDSDMSLHDNEGIKEDQGPKQELIVNDSIVMEQPEVKPAEKVMDVSDTDSEFEDMPPKPVIQRLPKEADKPTASDLFDSLMGSSPTSGSEGEKPKAPKKRSKKQDGSGDDEPKPKKKQAPKKKVKIGSDDDMFEEETKPKKRGPKKTAAPKKKNDDSDEERFPSGAGAKTKSPEFNPREKSGRARKTVTYTIEDDDEDSDF